MIIFDGVKDPDEFEEIVSFMRGFQGSLKDAVIAAAKEFGCSKSKVRSIYRKAERMELFDLVLVDDQSIRIPIAQVKSCNGFERACRAAIRRFPGTLKHLDLPIWKIEAIGGGRKPLVELLEVRA